MGFEIKTLFTKPLFPSVGSLLCPWPPRWSVGEKSKTFPDCSPPEIIINGIWLNYLTRCSITCSSSIGLMRRQWAWAPLFALMGPDIICTPPSQYIQLPVNIFSGLLKGAPRGIGNHLSALPLGIICIIYLFCTL